jgi:hypothetical protein
MPAQIITLIGGITAVVGLALVVFQMRKPQQKMKIPRRSMTARAGPLSFGVSTTFPGLIVLGFGVLLLIVGAIFGR